MPTETDLTTESTGTIDPGSRDNPTGKRPPTAEEAKLLKQLMKHKADKQALADKLKAFDGLDADKVRQLITSAEATKQQADEQRIRASGDFDQFKARIVTSHQQELAELHATAEAAKQQHDGQERLIRDLTIGNAFASSKFVNEMVLPPSKARKFYEDHFDVEDGRVVPYDAPRGNEDRLPLVDGMGEALAFDDAMKRIVEADPERDSLLRSKRMASLTKQNQAPHQARTAGSGINRIAASLAVGGIRTAQDAPDQPGPSLNHRHVVQHGPALQLPSRDVGPATLDRAIRAGSLPKAAPPRAR